MECSQRFDWPIFSPAYGMHRPKDFAKFFCLRRRIGGGTSSSYVDKKKLCKIFRTMHSVRRRKDWPIKSLRAFHSQNEIFYSGEKMTQRKCQSGSSCVGSKDCRERWGRREHQTAIPNNKSSSKLLGIGNDWVPDRMYQKLKHGRCCEASERARYPKLYGALGNNIWFIFQGFISPCVLLAHSMFGMPNFQIFHKN
jgi:hypothetical protein